VIEINGVPVGGSRAFVRRLQAGGVNEVVVSSTQTVWTSGDATDAEEELRQSLVNSLDLVDVSAALDTEEMQKFGNFTLGAISTDLGDGIDPISESVVRHVYCYLLSAVCLVKPSNPIIPLPL
jgi:hypothetical protein